MAWVEFKVLDKDDRGPTGINKFTVGDTYDIGTCLILGFHGNQYYAFTFNRRKREDIIQTAVAVT